MSGPEKSSRRGPGLFGWVLVFILALGAVPPVAAWVLHTWYLDELGPPPEQQRHP